MSLPHRSRLTRSAALATAATALVATVGLVAPASATAAPTPKAPAPATAQAGASVAAAASTAFGLRRNQRLVREGDTSGPNALVSGGLPPAGSDTVLSGFGTRLVLQGDGNLVEYEVTTGAVLFNTGTRDGAALVYQADGNVVLYNAAGQARFQTGTSGDTRGVVFSSYGNGQLIIQASDGRIVNAVGTAVTPGPGVVVARASSANGRYSLVVQNDGNVVAYDLSRSRAFWSTGTGGAGRVRLAAQLDGNLVLYAGGRAIWASGSSGTTAYYQLDMQDDGNVVLYVTNGTDRLRAVWASGTRG